MNFKLLVPTPPPSVESEKRVLLLFPPNEQDLVSALLLDDCGNNLPGLGNVDAVAMDGFGCAALKLPEGNLTKLDEALQLAKTDWRDLLMAAGFGESLTGHQAWLPTQTWR